MFGLGQQIGGGKGRLSRPVGDDQDLAGSGDHVDRHPAEDHLLGRRHIGVPRTDDLVDAGNRRRAEGQGRDRLGAADLEDPVHAAQLRGGGDQGMEPPVAGRRHEDDLADAGDPGGDRRHEDRGGIAGQPPRRIDADAGQGKDALTEFHPFFVRQPTTPPGAAVRGTVRFSGRPGGGSPDLPERPAPPRPSSPPRRGLDRRGGHGMAVPLGGIIKKGLIPPPGHVFHDPPDGRPEFGIEDPAPFPDPAGNTLQIPRCPFG